MRKHYPHLLLSLLLALLILAQGCSRSARNRVYDAEMQAEMAAEAKAALKAAEERSKAGETEEDYYEEGHYYDRSNHSAAANFCNDYKEFLSRPYSFFWGNLQKHRSPLTRYPANIGYGAGFFLAGGFPLVSMSHLPAYFGSEPENGIAFVLLPLLGGSVVGTAVGAPAWLVSGWWWPKPKIGPPPPPSSSLNNP